MMNRRHILLGGAALSLAGSLAGCGAIGARRDTSDVMTINGFVADGDIVFLSGDIDETAPQRFAQLRAANPGLTTLVVAEAAGKQGGPGALALGRMVRDAGMTTELRSDSVAIGGAVDVFLGGVTRVMQDGAILRMRGKNLGRNTGYKSYLDDMVGGDFAGFVDEELSKFRARDLRLHEIQRYGLISGNVVEVFGGAN